MDKTIKIMVIQFMILTTASLFCTQKAALNLCDEVSELKDDVEKLKEQVNYLEQKYEK